MLQVFILLLICSILGVVYTENAIAPQYEVNGRSLSERAHELGSAKVVFWVLCIYMVCFAGLRTSFNDTIVYISSYEQSIPDTLESLGAVNWTIGANPLFNIYQIILKSLISESGNVFIFISSAITVSCALAFIRKYSGKFSLSLFVYIGFCGYAFTMLAVKQTMAAGIGVWAVSSYLEGKYTKAILLFSASILIHPYVVLFLAAPFLCNTIWNKQTGYMLAATVVLSSSFGFLTDTLLTVSANVFGDQYNSVVFAPRTGTSIYRFIAYLICPILSFIYRNAIQEKNNLFVNISVNFSIVAASLIFLGLFGGGLVFGRLANYMSVFNCLATSFVVDYGIKDKRTRQLISAAILLLLSFYYFVYYRKYRGSYFGFGDPFEHISIFSLISRW